MNWFKKKFEQLSAKLNADELTDETATDAKNEDFREVEKAVGENKSTVTRFDNIEELKEISIGAVTSAVRVLGYGKAIVNGLTFHTAFADNAVENVSLTSLLKDEEFTKRIKRAFKAKGVKYAEPFVVDVIHESARVGKVTKITDGLGVEVHTPNDTIKKVKARVVATEGITWEPEYVLEPTGKQYFIGRCKNPKVENGPKIHNDIAFIGIEEENKEQYEINNFVSRSHAWIVFDLDSSVYKIYRSKFLNNPSHKIKIYNTSLNDFNGVSLSNSNVPHVLKNGDAITFNDKVVLEFFLEN
ncbi:MAG: hypothetical protein ACK5NK_13925 [Niabella sp.]